MSAVEVETAFAATISDSKSHLMSVSHILLTQLLQPF